MSYLFSCDEKEKVDFKKDICFGLHNTLTCHNTGNISYFNVAYRHNAFNDTVFCNNSLLYTEGHFPVFSIVSGILLL